MHLLLLCLTLKDATYVKFVDYDHWVLGSCPLEISPEIERSVLLTVA